MFAEENELHSFVLRIAPDATHIVPSDHFAAAVTVMPFLTVSFGRICPMGVDAVIPSPEKFIEQFSALACHRSIK